MPDLATKKLLLYVAEGPGPTGPCIVYGPIHIMIAYSESLFDNMKLSNYIEATGNRAT
jgi:hypothetical protein